MRKEIYKRCEELNLKVISINKHIKAEDKEGNRYTLSTHFLSQCRSNPVKYLKRLKKSTWNYNTIH